MFNLRMTPSYNHQLLSLHPLAMIHFSGVSKRYSKALFKPSMPALEDVSFVLDAGRTMGLIGANGAGKSTAIRLIMDFIRPNKGSIVLFGKSPSNYRNRKFIGYLPETASFPPNLSILDLIAFTAVTCGISSSLRHERAKSLLQELGLWQVRRQRLRTYSKGMQQRANFVLALLNDPQLLILDEPMSGLDPLGRRLIFDLIERLKHQGKTILFCSHILDDVDRLVDQLLVLHKGKMLFYGTPGELLQLQEASSVESAFLKLINAMGEGTHDF